MTDIQRKEALTEAIDDAKMKNNIDSIIRWYRDNKKELKLKNPFDMLEWYYKK
jgi:elongation factor P--beta-lysine ligase